MMQSMWFSWSNNC